MNLFNRKGLRSEGEYQHQSVRPLVSLVFVAPMLLIYEGGMILLGPDAMRNGADVWLRHFLDLLGFGQYFLLPALTCGVLLAWHHLSREPWTFRPNVLSGMLIESMLLGFVLLLIAQAQHRLFHGWSQTALLCKVESAEGTAGYLVGYFGAGIYEELLFRLMLIPIGVGVLRWSGLSTQASLVSTIVATSLIFSAAHYDFVTAGGEVFELYSFVFRFLAGAFFSMLFIYRGFGIAAGAHALYDIYVALF